jgi:hypothetical protein
MHALLLVVALVAAQPTLLKPTTQPLVPEGTSGIEGRVIRSDGTPIENASVELVLQQPHGVATTRTGTDGRYQFTRIAAGRYVLRLPLDGHVVMSSTAPGFSPPKITGISSPWISVTLERDRVTREINVTMARGVTVSGRITNDLGDPVLSANVTVTSTVDQTSRAVVIQTNAVGAFQALVPAGDVTIQAHAQPRGDGPEYLATFYPGVTVGADAAILRVSGGDAITGIEIALRRKSSFGLSGRVASIRNHELKGIEVTLSPLRGTVRSIRGKPDGSFSFGRLTPGRYLVSALATSSDGLEAGWQSLAIEDVPQEVELLVSLAGSVRGTVIVESGGPGVLTGARVGAALTDETRDVDPALRLQSPIAADGSFVLEGVYGPRTLRVIGLPDGWSVARVLVGGSEVSPPHVTVQSGIVIDDVVIVIDRH